MRGRRARLSIGSACTLAVSLACFIAPASVPATRLASSTHAPVSPADAASTHAYLEAVYRLDSTLVGNARASHAAETAFAEQLGRECHGVLAGEPKEGLGPRNGPPKTPRARGEQRRSELQKATIDDELARAELASTVLPDRSAIEAYASEVTSLSWSNPKIVELAHYHAARIPTALKASSAAGVCADMKEWAASGYHVLSPASRELQDAQRAELDAAAPIGSLEALLKPYENAADRRLIHRTKALQAKLLPALFARSRVAARLPRTLGVPEDPYEEREQEPVLGRGSTSARTTFVVRPEAPEGFLGRACKHAVSIEFEERSKSGSSSSTSSVCLGSHPDRQLSSSCGEGIESLMLVVAASVRTVRLRLSDGHTITSRVVRVPSKFGGPAGIYAEAVRERSSHPVSLTELDARGRVVKVLPLKTIRCPAQPPRQKTQEPKFVELAHGSTPGGKQFTIEGVLVHFGRRQTSFSLSVSAGLERLHDGSQEGGIRFSSGSPKTPPKAFPWSLGLECPPHEFAILYGILSPPGASVLTRTPEGLVPLTKVPIAADLHSNGPLVYGIFPTLPSELVVLRADGSTLYAESLTTRDTEEREYCEGYAEA